MLDDRRAPPFPPSPSVQAPNQALNQTPSELRQAQAVQRLQRSRERLWRQLGGATESPQAGSGGGSASPWAADLPAAWLGPMAHAALQLLAQRRPLGLLLGAGLLGAGLAAVVQRPAVWPLLAALPRRLPPALGWALAARLVRALDDSAGPAGPRG